ncbi:TatD family deoxyribonuclease [Alteromonas aestuariivivens]|uniref:TatD family deoxyribonuclease n=1 Tax=Alteromonas aestuariivivens TaxID=1938339 RepID=A0A3D8MF10_9ALTE|nr:TatD family hydrolase [Alteromonas aestuariivivens]RDV29342.1 TatD family deoxyribonuclease [Alteromonas aestuariivivens]
MIDSHCHLDFPDFDNDLDSVIAASLAQGVKRFMLPGTEVSRWHRQYSVAQRYPEVDLALGLHPYFLHLQPNDAFEQLQRQFEAVQPSVLAVGEIGLDATVKMPAREQEHWLERQLLLAKDCGLPVILHHRKTQDRLLSIIRKTGFDQGGVVHAFSGSEQVANAFIEKGFLLGIGGTITYARAAKTRHTISRLALQHLLLETDAPDMPMCGRQGQRNSPEFLSQVVSSLSQLSGVEEQEIIRQTTDNYCRLFRVLR